MKLSRIGWMTFRVPFGRPFATAHGPMLVREGLLLRSMTDDGLTGLGEASAVPGFGGDLAETVRTLQKTAPRLVGAELAEVDKLIQTIDVGRPSSAAAACALDTAVCDLQAQAAGIPLTQLLGGDPNRAVPVNATVGGLTTAEAVHSAVAAVAAGFRCIKLKVGVAGSEAAEVARIQLVRDAIGPAIGLRIDANGAWDVATAVRILRAVECFDLELVEQPVPADNLAGMAQVRSAVGMPVAADESVGGVEQAQRVIAAGAADILIIKPMLAGGLRPARAVAELARASGLRVIVTTTIDTGVGIAAALHLAATLPDPLPACGLATGPLLVDDLLDHPLSIQDGLMRVPSGPGLGVRLDPSRLAFHGGAWCEIGG